MIQLTANNPTGLPLSERQDIEAAKAAIRAAGSALEPARATARQLVNIAGEALPGIDDVTIGRVLLWTASVIQQLADTGHGPKSMGNIFILAAVDLTAEEQ